MRARPLLWLAFGSLGATPLALGGALLLLIAIVAGGLSTGAGGVSRDDNEDEEPGGPNVMAGQAPPTSGVVTSVGQPDPSRIGQSFAYTAPAAIDYDGDPQAYAPEGSGLPTSDYLANAGRPGNWWGIETDNGRRDGNPKIGPGGYYISQTSLRIGGRSLNAQEVPFVALPKGFQGAKLGDYVLLKNESNGKTCWAIFGDVSPKQSKVEMSPAAARQIGVGFEKRGTTSNAGAITATVYPGTANLGALR